MIVLKGLIYTLIITTSSFLGIMLAKKYAYRVDELKEFKSALNILKTKIRYTYAPLNEIFIDISQSTRGNISLLFTNAAKNLETYSATKSFYNAIESTTLSVSKDDKKIMQGLSKLLGKTDAEGQINEIELTETFLDTQIEKAEVEKEKNYKLYKTLGIISGVGLVIILL